MEQILLNADDKIEALKDMLKFDPTATPESLLRNDETFSQIHGEVVEELAQRRYQAAKDKYLNAMSDLVKLAEQLDDKKKAFLKEYGAGVTAIEKKAKELRAIGIDIDARLLPRKNKGNDDKGDNEG